jgi:hypothetical protein
MANSQARHIVDTALLLRRQNKSASALDILDQVMSGHHGSRLCENTSTCSHG